MHFPRPMSHVQAMLAGERTHRVSSKQHEGSSNSFPRALQTRRTRCNVHVHDSVHVCGRDEAEHVPAHVELLLHQLQTRHVRTQQAALLAAAAAAAAGCMQLGGSIAPAAGRCCTAEAPR